MKVKVHVKRGEGAKKPAQFQSVDIYTDFIKLGSFLKFVNAVETGGQAKDLIEEGRVEVNGEVCTARGKKLFVGDKVSVLGENYILVGNTDVY